MNISTIYKSCRMLGVCVAAVTAMAGMTSAHAENDDEEGVPSEGPALYVGNNDGATITGAVSARATGNPWQCPEKSYCVWTEPNAKGTIFMMEACRTYAMHGWNGYGSHFNHQVGGVAAWLRDRNGNNVSSLAADFWQPEIDMTPFWFIRNC